MLWRIPCQVSPHPASVGVVPRLLVGAEPPEPSTDEAARTVTSLRVVLLSNPIAHVRAGTSSLHFRIAEADNSPIPDVYDGHRAAIRGLDWEATEVRAAGVEPQRHHCTAPTLASTPGSCRFRFEPQAELIHFNL